MNNKKNFLGTIKSKLYISVFLTVFSLSLISATAFLQGQNMVRSAEKIYKNSLKGALHASEIRNNYLMAQGDIARAPAELDLEKIKTLRESTNVSIDRALKTIENYKTLIDEKGLEIVSIIQKDLIIIKDNGEKVFEFAELFAADQANEILNSSFKTATQDLEAQMNLLSENENLRAQSAYNALLAAKNKMYTYIAMLVIFSMLTAGGFGYITARRIGSQTTLLTKAMKDLAAGNVGKEIPYANNQDEIGDMAKAVLVFKENKIQADKLAYEQESQNQKQIDRANKIAQCTRDFDISVKKAMASLLSSSDELRMTSENMKKTSEETKMESSIIASATEESNANIQSVSCSVEQLTTSIQKIAEQITTSTDISREVSYEVEIAAGQIESLLEASRKIGEVVSLIQDIAEQTNLLALNATIEAARAGEAGKGFAVVATEVKTLAGETASATDKISSQIKNIQEQTQKTVDAVQTVKGRIINLNEISDVISLTVEEQHTATIEISRNALEASQSAQEVSKSIYNITDKAGDAQNVSNDVLKASTTITHHNKLLDDEISEFLDTVKSL